MLGLEHQSGVAVICGARSAFSQSHLCHTMALPELWHALNNLNAFLIPWALQLRGSFRCGADDGRKELCVFQALHGS